jgi:hypothetical protein
MILCEVPKESPHPARLLWEGCVCACVENSTQESQRPASIPGILQKTSEMATCPEFHRAPQGVQDITDVNICKNPLCPEADGNMEPHNQWSKGPHSSPTYSGINWICLCVGGRDALGALVYGSQIDVHILQESIQPVPHPNLPVPPPHIPRKKALLIYSRQRVLTEPCKVKSWVYCTT